MAELAQCRSALLSFEHGDALVFPIDLDRAYRLTLYALVVSDGQSLVREVIQKLSAPAFLISSLEVILFFFRLCLRF